jgi:hypothetical protein
LTETPAEAEELNAQEGMCPDSPSSKNLGGAEPFRADARQCSFRDASRAIRQAEVGAAKTMIERTEQRFDIKPAYLA